VVHTPCKERAYPTSDNRQLAPDHHLLSLAKLRPVRGSGLDDNQPPKIENQRKNSNQDQQISAYRLKDYFHHLNQKDESKMINSPRKSPNTRALGNKLTGVIIVFIVLDILKQAVSPQGERSQLRIHQITE